MTEAEIECRAEWFIAAKRFFGLLWHSPEANALFWAYMR
jgi:hypothetical protein